MPVIICASGSGNLELNPYFNNQDPMSISQGNPDLKSEKSHAFDIAYSNFSAKFNINVSLRHSFGNNGIERVSRLINNEDGEIFDNNPEHRRRTGLCTALMIISARIGIPDCPFI